MENNWSVQLGQSVARSPRNLRVVSSNLALADLSGSFRHWCGCLNCEPDVKLKLIFFKIKLIKIIYEYLLFLTLYLNMYIITNIAYPVDALCPIRTYRLA